jgi:hypothetical protein
VRGRLKGMNWSLGLLRLWIAFTVLWIGWMGIVLYQQWPIDVSDSSSLEGTSRSNDRWIVTGPKKETNPFDVSVPGTLAFRRRTFWKETVPTGLQMAIGIPAGFFAFGWTCLWIGRGFRTGKR